MDEPTAIARLKRGDVSGLAHLVEQHQLKAVRTAQLITRDRALAEDVVQSAFIRIYQHADQFDETRRFEPWFMRTVVNAAIQASKRQQKIIPIEDGEYSTQDGEFDPQAWMERAETSAEIRQALDQLTPEQRAVIVYRYYLDMSEDEMADRLETPRGTVKSRLHTARTRLRSLLQPSIKQEDAG